MTITNFSELIEKIVELLQENDREKPQNSVEIMMYVNKENGKADPFMTDGDEYANHALCLGTLPAHYDDTWLEDMCYGLDIDDIAGLLEIDKDSLIYDTNVYKYGGEAEPEEITVQDVENYVYHNPALWLQVQNLYTDYLKDIESTYYEAAMNLWQNFVEVYNYESGECGQSPIYWEG